MYQQLIARELESLGGQIHFYTMGEACLADLHLEPSIVVLDYDLDGDLNGLDTMREIRKFNPEIYVILFSNKKDLNSYENVAEYGSFDFLEKRDQSFRLLKQMIRATHNL